MNGGDGDDTYVVDDAGDTIIDSSGTDTVIAGFSYVLGGNLENLVLGAGASDGTGNSLANTLTGNDADNRLEGQKGKDVLNGLAGDDELLGGKGKDILIGGLGKDIHKGGGGKDTFVFNTELSKANKDKIKDFKVNKDKIGLDMSVFDVIGKKLNKGEFVIGKKAKDKNDHIIYKKNKLIYDENGSKKGRDHRYRQGRQRPEARSQGLCRRRFRFIAEFNRPGFFMAMGQVSRTGFCDRALCIVSSCRDLGYIDLEQRTLQTIDNRRPA